MIREVQQFISVKINIGDEASEEKLERYKDILNRAVDRIIKEGDKDEVAMVGDYAIDGLELL